MIFRKSLKIVFQNHGALQRTLQLQRRGLKIEPKKKALLEQLDFSWYGLPITFLGVFLAFDQLRSYRLNKIKEGLKDKDNVGKYYDASRFEVFLFEVLPLRMTSRAWGWINEINLPTFLREPILGLYARSFDCQLDEAQEPDLTKYRNLQEFFGRSLKPELRPIQGDGINTVVSPSDGKVVHFGQVKNGKLEQVKGVNYQITEFLGPQTWQSTSAATLGPKAYQNQLLHSSNGDTELYHCTIYLAPGDYHRYHSPSDWTVNFRRHFAGKLYSVRPSFATWFPDLFSVNERVAYIGKWKHGFFSMIPVGATNVGSMKMPFDPELTTNKFGQLSTKFDVSDKEFKNGPKFGPGDPFGEFKLGSTIVLIFEAPKNFQFNIERGQSLKYGQAIGSLGS